MYATIYQETLYEKMADLRQRLWGDGEFRRKVDEKKNDALSKSSIFSREARTP